MRYVIHCHVHVFATAFPFWNSGRDTESNNKPLQFVKGEHTPDNTAACDEILLSQSSQTQNQCNSNIQE